MTASLTPWKARRTQAYRDGAIHADGGLDKHNVYVGAKRAAYEMGFREQRLAMQQGMTDCERRTDPHAIIRALLPHINVDSIGAIEATADAEAYIGLSFNSESRHT